MRALYLIIFLCIYGHSFAQVEHEIALDGANKIIIEADYAEVKIITQDIDRIILKSEIDINDGKHNDRLNIDTKPKKNVIYLSSSIDDPESIPKVKTVYDKKGNIISVEDVEGTKGNRYFDDHDGMGKIRIEQKINVHHTIYVPEFMEVSVKTTYGDVSFSGKVISNTSLSSTYAVIEANPTQLQAPLKICSTYSSIDVSLPASLKADVSMESQYGQFYTDLTLDVKESKSDSKFLASFNGGGKPIYMESPYSNIYLRKM